MARSRCLQQVRAAGAVKGLKEESDYVLVLCFLLNLSTIKSLLVRRLFSRRVMCWDKLVGLGSKKPLDTP